MAALKLSLPVVEDLSRQYLHQKSEAAFAILSYEIKVSSDVATGFLGRHETLHIQVQQKPSGTLQELVFFIKSIPNDVASRAEYIEEFGVFKKESIFYRDVLPKLQAGLTDYTANCYYIQEDMLVFEHLGELGFHMASDRSGILDFQHLNCALKSLARMHASSIIFEATNNQKISKVFPDAVRENAYPTVPSRVRTMNFTAANESFCELIKLMPKYKDSDCLEYILREFPLRMRKIYELSQTSTKYYNVFSHGDLWANNLLFKYENGHPVESRLVDFQLTRYAPPILDVITLLSIPTSSGFRHNNLYKLVTNYHAMMKELLRQKGLEIEDYIPFKQFVDSVKEFALCGLIESCLFSHLTILPPELTHSLTADTNGFEDFFSRKRNEICLKAFQTDDLYRFRMTDMISDIIDNYIIV